MDSIEQELRKLMRSGIIDRDHDCGAEALADRVCMLISEICLLDESENEILDQWEQAIRSTTCEVFGGHDWMFDQCGYWGHQLCVRCSQWKYPELGALSCREAVEKLGDIREYQYRAKIGANQ